MNEIEWTCYTDWTFKGWALNTYEMKNIWCQQKNANNPLEERGGWCQK